MLLVIVVDDDDIEVVLELCPEKKIIFCNRNKREQDI
jgi:hypothetical protein